MNPFALLTLVSLTAAAINAQEQTVPKPPEPTVRLTEQQLADGWHVLFDGTGAAAWRGYRKEGLPDRGWSIDAGTLHNAERGGGGDLITRRQYRNFELAFEFKVAPGASSGVLYRVAETEHPPYWTGPEFQVIDDAAQVEADSRHLSGALYALYAAENASPRPAGEWNQARIRVDGDHVEHWLNGSKIVEATFGSDDWNTRVADSKFAKWDGFGEHQRGHISLQDHGNEVWYRSVVARELDPSAERLGEPIALFDGSEDSLWNWSVYLDDDSSTMSDVWMVQDDEIVCVGTPRGYLYTKQTWTNFVLRVTWRFDAEVGSGNSGILLRATGDHQCWPRSIESQLEGGNAGDLRALGQFPMRTDPSRRVGFDTRKTHRAENALGERNTCEIICDGGWLRVRVNGQVVNEAWDCDEIAGHVCLLSEGALIYVGEVELTVLDG